jgi:hypothetical protein
MGVPGLVIPVSGPYLGTWNALPLGTMNDDGFELGCTIQGQEVRESDAYGMTLVEAIYRGQNWRLRIRGLEWDKTGLLGILQMFGKSGAARSLTPTLTAIGDRWTKFCQALVLTAILGDPPAFPLSLTATNAGFSPNSQTLFNLTSKLREMPLELVLLPYQTVISSVTYAVPFTST